MRSMNLLIAGGGFAGVWAAMVAAALADTVGASTRLTITLVPPGAGAHGMCGYNAAMSALTRLERTAGRHPRRSAATAGALLGTFGPGCDDGARAQ